MCLLDFKLHAIPLETLTYHHNLSQSSHSVQLYHDQFNKLFFVKLDADLNANEEEYTFSALYILDIGKSAARTLPLIDKAGKIIGIVSEGLPNFTSYSDLRQPKNPSQNETSKNIIRSHTYLMQNNRISTNSNFKYIKGLASILASSYLYFENDLHRNNFGIQSNVSPKITITDITDNPPHKRQEDKRKYFWGRLDFGMSFSTLLHKTRKFDVRHPLSSQVTLKDLKTFPSIEKNLFYWPTNLTIYNSSLNLIGRLKGNAYDEKDKELFQSLSEMKEFQKEKNDFLLRLFLIPLDAKKNLIKANITDKYHAAIISDFVENRIKSFRWSALADDTFRIYLTALYNEFKEHKDKNIKHLKSHLFKTVIKIQKSMKYLSIKNNIYQKPICSIEDLERSSFFLEISPFFDLIECFCRKNYTDDLTNEEPNHWINLIYASQLSEIISLSNKYSTPQRALTNNFSYLTEAKREQLIDSALGEMLFSSIYHTKNDVYSVQKTLNSMHEIMTRMSFYKPINETLDKLHSLIKYEKNPDDIEKTIKNIYRFKSEFIFPWLEKILPKESHQSNEFFFYYSEAYKRLHEIYYYLNHIIENKNYFSAQDIIESLNQKLELIHQKTPFTKGIQSKQFEKILAEITSLLIAPTPSAPSMTNHLTSCILFFGRSKNINYPSRSSITPNDDSPQEITPLIC